MNNVFNRFGAWLLIALYSVALAVSTQAATSNRPVYTTGIHKQIVTTGTSQQIERHAFPGKTIIEHAPFSGIQVFTVSFPQFYLQIDGYQFVYPESRIQQYLKYSEQLLIYSRKSDLIFPFHYFW